MRIELIAISLTVLVFGCSKQFTTLAIEEENVDSNNKIYKPGSVFIYDYEIVKAGKRLKLQKNKGVMANAEFELVPIASEEVGVDKIHLIVKSVSDKERVNENQTQVYYLQEPVYSSMSATGIVENDKNVWMHPIREGFFAALETAPFPYVKFPLQTGVQWSDEMKISENWSNEMWGSWDGNLALSYSYEITDTETLKTDLGDIECYKINSVADSDLGQTSLVSYFSPEHGFVRMEYELMNDLKVKMWLVDTMSGRQFNDVGTFFRTKKYLKE